MWREQISQISKIREETNRKLNLPANENELSRFHKAVVEKFGEDILPQQYYEFLQTVNGIVFNGLTIYGIDSGYLDSMLINQVVDGFFDANEAWEPIQDEDELIFFGHDDISWYCYNVSKKCFVELDKPSAELMETFCDFTNMLEFALSKAIGDRFMDELE